MALTPLASALLFAASVAISAAMWSRTPGGPRHLYVQAAVSTLVVLWTGVLLLIAFVRG